MSTPKSSPPPACQPLVDGNEVQVVKDALNADITDFGVCVYHISTNRVYLRPASLTNPVGHAALAMSLNLNRSECRGFVIAKHPTSGQFAVENTSGLNVGSGGLGMGMPQPMFDSLKQTLVVAGL